MPSKGRIPNVMFGASLRPESAVVAIMLVPLLLIFVFLFITLTAQPSQAQTFNVIYNFTGGEDGSQPNGLTLDIAGNLYGTAYMGGPTGGNCGSYSCGTVFKLANWGSGWFFTRLYNFHGGLDGQWPLGRPIFGPEGSLYSTTAVGGDGGCTPYGGCGTVFKLLPAAQPPPSILAGWTETVLYRFGGSDGSDPVGDLVFDQARNLYGTAPFGGVDGDCGIVYKLTSSNSGWTQNIIHNFTDDDGCQPWPGVIFDQAGNLYGVTEWGGSYARGTVFQLTPSATGWTLNTLYSFTGANDGSFPLAGLIFDRSGNLYGATYCDGSGGGGAVFRLSPSGSGWTFSVLYDLPGDFECGYGAVDRLAMDAAGNLYGATYFNGADGYGSVFKLTNVGGDWTYADLYDFTGGNDGFWPSGPSLDSNGNLYGTTVGGGSHSHGVVWEITP